MERSISHQKWIILVHSLLRLKFENHGIWDKTLLCDGEEHYHCVLCRSLDGSEMRALLERRHTSWGNLERDLLVSFILFLFSQPAASWGHFHIGACFRSKLPFSNFAVAGPPWSGLPAAAANIKMKPNPTTIWCWCWWTPKWQNMFWLQCVRECQWRHNRGWLNCKCCQCVTTIPIFQYLKKNLMFNVTQVKVCMFHNSQQKRPCHKPQEPA